MLSLSLSKVVMRLVLFSKFTICIINYEQICTCSQCLQDFFFFAGKYLLVDSGYPSRYGFLPPYPHVRYHFDDDDGEEAPLPVGREETFNYMHSALLNTVERVFGVIKSQWRVLRGISLFGEEESQTKIIVAAFVLYNFMIDSNDPHFMTQHPPYNGYPHDPQAPPLHTWYNAPNSEKAMTAYREYIANQVYHD